MHLLECKKIIKFITKIHILICKPAFLWNFTFLEITQKVFREASVEDSPNRLLAVLENPVKENEQTQG
jgi:hypothetical protein